MPILLIFIILDLIVDFGLDCIIVYIIFNVYEKLIQK